MVNEALDEATRTWSGYVADIDGGKTLGRCRFAVVVVVHTFCPPLSTTIVDVLCVCMSSSPYWPCPEGFIQNIAITG
ncbi:hypothetical protein VNO78_08939 [Psophocarpus tetragonolobus]|uniref:Uncharacterized protein n=1 Tax=Psophocarpus tetragonolobus TaxID=3891 RepID=A0AAN9SVX1_PSOTE